MGAAQPSVSLPSAPKNACDFGDRASGETHGVVLTRSHVVDLILDLSEYTADRDLGSLSLLEPSCGHGAFVGQAVERLMLAAKKFRRSARSLGDAILCFDINVGHVELARQAVISVLLRHGVKKGDAKTLAERWFVCADFLLAPQDRLFDFVVGNPPYIRIEQLPRVLQDEYRRRYRSLYDRADLYVAFIERGLDLISCNGVLSFVCADRWTLNRYGAPLRKLVSERFSVRCYIDLHRASPFDSEVIAYPSIFAISPGTTKQVQVGVLETASADECRAVSALIVPGRGGTEPGVRVSVYDSWFKGDEPWIINSPEHLAVLRGLERRFRPIESDGTRVGIGVATGNDGLYIVGRDADIEPDRLVPLVMREDIQNGQIKNGGHLVINTFASDGGLVDLNTYPRLGRYLAANATDLRKRHIAQKNPGSWFRTIDRVYPELVSTPKLLIPDIAGSNEVVFDQGSYHPHHNLYYIASDIWDMEVLGGLISSRVALFFVWSYAVKMRGGYLRFQAQYLRRIRVPAPSAIPAKLANALKKAFRTRQFARLDYLALEAYGLEGLPTFDFVDTRR